MRFRKISYDIWVSLAGPGANLSLAVLAGLCARISVESGFLLSGDPMAGKIYYAILFLFVFINVALMCFNIIPVPPLDGSHVFFRLFVRTRNWVFQLYALLERFGFMLLLVLFVFSPLRHYFADAVETVATALLGEKAFLTFIMLWSPTN
jgi:Zn-dependent protease